MAETVSWEDLDELLEDEPKTTSTKGVCKVCGIQLPDKRRAYCDDHQPAKLTTPAPSSKPTKKTSTSVPKDTKKYAEFVSKLLILLTVMYAWRMVEAYKIHDPEDKVLESLELTDAEADDIAAPFARMIARTEPVAKVMGPLIDNNDILDALYAIWSWQRRVKKTLRHYKPIDVESEEVPRAHS